MAHYTLIARINVGKGRFPFVNEKDLYPGDNNSLVGNYLPGLSRGGGSCTALHHTSGRAREHSARPHASQKTRSVRDAHKYPRMVYSH
jgi:hypothetical protein